MGLLHFDPDTDLVIQVFFHAKGIVSAIPNHPFFFLVTNKSTKQKRIYKRKKLGRLRENVYNIFSTEAPLKNFWK